MLLICLVLTIYSSLTFSISDGLLNSGRRFDIAEAYYIALGASFFAFLFILASIVIFALPAIYIGQRKGYLNSLRNTLILAAIVGLMACIVTTGWLLGGDWSWLLLSFIGSSTGLLGGYLWWHWIGPSKVITYK